MDTFINRLKKAFNTNTYKELAIALDTKEGTIKTWVRRNSYDYKLIVSKCNPNINFNWLFLGKGSMLLDNPTFDSISDNLTENESFLERQLDKKDKEIYRLHEELGSLKEQIKVLKSGANKKEPPGEHAVGNTA